MKRPLLMGGHERDILGNDNLPKLEIEARQKKCPLSNCTVSDSLGKSKSNKLEFLTNELFVNFKNQFNKIGKIPNDRKAVKSHISNPFS